LIKKNNLNIQHIVSMCPNREFGGGIVTTVRNLIGRLFNKFDFKLIGVTYENIEVENNTGLKNIEFYPIVKYKLKDIGNRSSLKYGIALFKKKRELDKLKSIFHVHRVDSAFPLLYPFRIKNPVIVHIHGSNTYWKFLGKSWIFRKLHYFMEWLVINRADKVIMVSKKRIK